jgi:hypothetical protein
MNFEEFSDFFHHLSHSRNLYFGVTFEFRQMIDQLFIKLDQKLVIDKLNFLPGHYDDRLLEIV